LDGGKIGEIALDEGDWGIWDEGFDICDCGKGFGFGAAGEVDVFWVVFGELESGFFSKADIA